MYTFQFRRCYRGPLRAAIFDWAGTTVDYGCQAPTTVFVEAFAQRDVKITPQEARGPMGMHKLDHMRAIAHLPAVAQRWQAVHGRPPDESDVQAMYEQFIPLQIQRIAQHADVIPGCADTIALLRQRGIKIGSSTGYDRQMMQILVPAARDGGFEPDCVVCSSDVSVGRPAPWMAIENARQLGVYPLSAVVKIDDTVPGIEAGLNAGMWTIAVAKTGNEVGLTRREVADLPPDELHKRVDAASRRLSQAGAHYVVDGVDSLLPCIDAIEQRLAAGETP
jgi:phosphonoacetaldehyde hydrolase